MKSRLGASITLLFAGGNCRGSICKALEVKPKFDLFHDRCRSNRHLLQGCESLNRSLHCSIDEEDDFSELGPSVSQVRGTLPKLVTEKPEPTSKVFPSIKALESGPHGPHLTMKNVFRSLSKSSPASCPKPGNNGNPGSNNHHKVAYDLKGSNSVSIENVPATVDLAELIEAVSVFGKVSIACMRTLPSGLSCCDVEFKNESSSRRAAIVGTVNVNRNLLPVRPLHAQETCAIRIQSISKKTTDPAIHSLCKSIGALEGLVRASGDVVHAIFSTKTNPDIEGLLAKLNNISVDNCQWSACLLPNSSSVLKFKYMDGTESNLASEIGDYLEAAREIHAMKGILIEDLQALRMKVMHLEGQHAVSSRGSEICASLV